MINDERITIRNTIMGWYVSYEICFENVVNEWDDDVVRATLELKDIDARIMYLHDHDTPKAIAQVYTSNTVHEVMKVLYELYGIAMKGKLYDTNDCKYTYPA